MWRMMLLTGFGGFIGTCCRFLVNRLFALFYKAPFPLATFLINIVGCLLFGLIVGWLNRYGMVNQKVYSFLIVGFCGGFTTFSTFSFESLKLMGNGEMLVSFSYMGLSVLIGLFATWIGLNLTN